MCMYTHAYTTHTKGCVCLITIDGVMPPHSTYQGLSQLDPIPSSLLLGQCHVHINFWFLSTPPSKKKKVKSDLEWHAVNWSSVSITVSGGSELPMTPVLGHPAPSSGFYKLLYACLHIDTHI